MKIILSLIFSFFVLSSIAQKQELFTVIAHSGLSLRKEPALNSKKIALLRFNQEVKLLKCTNIALSIRDEAKHINGYWVKVETLKGLVGYVFDAYLLERNTSIKDIYICENGENSCQSQFSFKNFDVVIYNYLVEEHDEGHQLRNDTLFVYEYVFNSLGDKLIEVFPKTTIDSVGIYYTYGESILEIYKPADNVSDDDWYKNRVKWYGHEEMKRLHNKGLFFRVPDTDYEGQEEFRQQQMELRDTMVVKEGEFEQIATLVYQDKACIYMIEKIILKIVLFKEGKEIGTKYIDVILSYGC